MKCPGPMCETNIAKYMVACHAHYHSLPETLRQRWRAAWGRLDFARMRSYPASEIAKRKDALDYVNKEALGFLEAL